MSDVTRWEPVLTRWNPFKELEDMEKRLSGYFGRPAVRTESGKEAMTVAEWSPRVDITEDDKEYVIKADLPDVKKEDIKLTVQDNVMSISGERKYEKEEKGKKYHRVERSYGSFMRSFTVPDDADASKVSAIVSYVIVHRSPFVACSIQPEEVRDVPTPSLPRASVGHSLASRDHGISSSSVVVDRAPGSVRHVSDRRGRHEWTHLAPPAVRSTTGGGSVSDFQEP
ncbi:MAG: Hsp20/alpha crystallin family protein [Nitrospirae bacterium]|nr:Hsp20/alpha crystallin family protein [Nitrospirota bacterium]